ncbi:MAG TPA: cysteine hydrolase [Bacteroidaceae bacterium]|nr:cysteine hydrolase [Bacteroidaceae bacterium]
MSLNFLNLQAQKSALLLIDIQNFYFPGGRMALENPDAAGMNAGLILDRFRINGDVIIHVRHDMSPGGEIHNYVKPQQGELVITKNQVNAFSGTELLSTLEGNGIEQLIICGMQTHLCVEAAVRAAHDFKFKCILVTDACATKALQYKENIISAKYVHYSTLSTLEGHYATLITTDELLKNFEQYVPR